MNKIRQIFDVKSEESSKFRYLGILIEQKHDRIVMSQDDYVTAMGIIPSKTGYTDETELNEEELTICRGSIGKLNWLSTQTRPDICFEVSDLTASLKEKRVLTFSYFQVVQKFPSGPCW